MAIEYRKKLAVLTDIVSVEDAEPLLGWAQKGRDLKVDLSGCSHLHPASLQVLLAAGAQVVAWPHDVGLSRWLQTILPGR